MNKNKKNILLKYYQYLGLKRKNIKNSLCIILMYITFYNSAYAVKPDYYRFTEEIYDQRRILTQQNLKSLSPEEINEKLKEELLNRKKEELGKNFINKIKENIDILEKEFGEASKGQFKKAVIDILKRNVENAPLISMLITTAALTGPVGSLIGVGVAVAAGVVAAVGAEYWKVQLNKKISYRRDPQDIIKKMHELEDQCEELVAGLDSEPIADLELRYIKQKRELKNSELIKQIETGLIQARSNDYFFELNSPFIDYALSIPLNPKPLLDPNNIDKSKQDLIKRFKNDPNFSMYDKNIKEKYLEIIIQAAVDSLPIKLKYIPMKKAYHFFGDPSTFKSSGAREIARFLGVPYFEKAIIDDSEINASNLFGAPRSLNNPNMGWLMDAILKKVERDQKTYQNAFLIINDFPINSPIAQRFLLNIADLDMESFRNPYFEGQIDISRLNLIITSNDELDLLEPKMNRDGKYIPNKLAHAVRTRFIPVKHPRLREGRMKELGEQYLESIVKLHQPPSFHKFEYVDSTKIKVTYDPAILRQMGLEGRVSASKIVTEVEEAEKDTVLPRELAQHYLPQAINKYIIDIIEKRKLSFESYKKLLQRVYKTPSITNLTVAARKKHPLFISIFKEITSAALYGHPLAICILKDLHEGKLTIGILALEQKVKDKVGTKAEQRKNAERIVTLYTNKKNTRKMKEWWGKAYQLGSEQHIERIFEHLKSKFQNVTPLDAEDYQLLALLQNYQGAHIQRASINILSKMSTPCELGAEYESNELGAAEKWYKIAEKNGDREATYALARLSHSKGQEDQERYEAVAQRTDFEKVSNLEHVRAFKEICKKQGNFEHEEQWSRRLFFLTLPQPLHAAFDENVKSLSELRTIVTLLGSSQTDRQKKGFKKLFETDEERCDSWGEIRRLWDKNRFSESSITEAFKKPFHSALVNRVDRFEKLDDKCEVICFHLKLVQALTDRLLDFTTDLHKILPESATVKKNINYLAHHLTGLCFLDDHLSPKVKKKIFSDIENHRRWFYANSSNNKTKLLIEHYKANESTVETWPEFLCDWWDNMIKEF